MHDSLIPELAHAGFACRSEGPSGNGRWMTIPNSSTVIRSFFQTPVKSGNGPDEKEVLRRNAACATLVDFANVC